ncbi:MAG: ABC transporter permease [Polyangiaceae bacterium]
MKDRAVAVRALTPLVLVILIGAVFNQEGAFFRWEAHRAMLREIAVVGILACGMTVVVVTAGIDLAVGSVLALSAVSLSTLLMPLGWSGPAAVLAVLAMGLCLGALAGILVARLGMQPFVVTLAAMVFARGLAKHIADGKKVTTYVVGDDGVGRLLDTPPLFAAIDRKILGDQVAIVTVIFALVVVTTFLVLRRLVVGRYLYAVGGNAPAAFLAGVPVQRTLVFAYAYSGLCAALAGICQAAQETQGDPETGLGYELDAIAMVVLGGTSLMGGRGGVGLTLVGALTLGYLQKVLSLNAFSTETRLMLTGGIIVAAVLFQRRSSSR